MNSKAKGKRGELELVKHLKERGHDARRGQQFQGGPESPDIVCPSLPFHFECKRTKRINVYEALEQATRDAAGRLTPLVAHKRNRGEWLAILRLDDLIALADRPTKIEVVGK